MATTENSTKEPSVVRIKESFSGSAMGIRNKFNTGKHASIQAPGTSLADNKRNAKERAAHMEKLLHSRNAGYVLNYLERKTHFDKDQIRALQKMYRRFKGSSRMDRLRFRELVATLLGLTDGIMLDRIFQAFDSDNEGSVSETEWIIGLSVQLRGTLDQQIAYTYDVYDINGDRSIGREEISNFYRNCMHAIPGILEPEEVDDATNEMVELAMKKFDINKDGNIRFSEYRHIIRRDPLLLESFGECLPKDTTAVPLMALLDPNERSYSCYLSRPGDSGWSVERERYLKYEANHHHKDYFHDHELDEHKSESPISPMSWSSMGASNPVKKNTYSSRAFKPAKKNSLSYKLL